MRAIGLLLIGVLGGAFIGGEPEWKSLNGLYLLSPATIIDPGPDEPVELLLLHVTGESAEEILKAMPDKGSDVGCGGERLPGMTRKVARHLECARLPDGSTTCTLGVSLRTGETRRGYVCD